MDKLIELLNADSKFWVVLVAGLIGTFQGAWMQRYFWRKALEEEGWL